MRTELSSIKDAGVRKAEVRAKKLEQCIELKN